MDDPAAHPEDPSVQLREALARSRALLARIQQDAANLEQSPPDLDAEKMTAGRHALEQAMAAAARLVASLEGALRLDEGEASASPSGDE